MIIPNIWNNVNCSKPPAHVFLIICENEECHDHEQTFQKGCEALLKVYKSQCDSYG